MLSWIPAKRHPPGSRWSHRHTQIHTLTTTTRDVRLRRTRLSSMHRSRAHHSSDTATPGARHPLAVPVSPSVRWMNVPFRPSAPPLALRVSLASPSIASAPFPLVYVAMLLLNASDPAPTDRTSLHAALRCLPGLVHPQPVSLPASCRAASPGLSLLNLTGQGQSICHASTPVHPSSSEEAQSSWAVPHIYPIEPFGGLLFGSSSGQGSRRPLKAAARLCSVLPLAAPNPLAR